mmetsp:Transcript_929/g.3159  ORF Transcript_929/g.3159 Transcript_929/m.3159 type:complete len:202 (+) Transcript_929:601-1206(+)
MELDEVPLLEPRLRAAPRHKGAVGRAEVRDEGVGAVEGHRRVVTRDRSVLQSDVHARRVPPEGQLRRPGEVQPAQQLPRVRADDVEVHRRRSLRRPRRQSRRRRDRRQEVADLRLLLRRLHPAGGGRLGLLASVAVRKPAAPRLLRRSLAAAERRRTAHHRHHPEVKYFLPEKKQQRNPSLQGRPRRGRGSWGVAALASEG